MTYSEVRIWVVDKSLEPYTLLGDHVTDRHFSLEIFPSFADVVSTVIDGDKPLPDILIVDADFSGCLCRGPFAQNERLALGKVRSYDFSMLLVSYSDPVKALAEAFDAGAAEVVCAPPRMVEMAYKIDAILASDAHRRRRHSRSKRSRLTFDVAAFVVNVGATERVKLAPKEFQLLLCLFSEGDRFVTRDELTDHIWKGESPGRKNLDVHLCSLRKKMEPLGVAIHFDRFQGYKLSIESDDPSFKRPA